MFVATDRKYWGSCGEERLATKETAVGVARGNRTGGQAIDFCWDGVYFIVDHYYIVWTDNRTGDLDVYGQRLTYNGYCQWGAGGMPICNLVGAQQTPKIIFEMSEGYSIFYPFTAGMFVVWDDYRYGNADIYAQHINYTGAVNWQPNGTAICSAAGDQHILGLEWYPAPYFTIHTQAFLVWSDERAGNLDIYGQLIDYQGVFYWNATGFEMCTAAGGQRPTDLAIDQQLGKIGRASCRERV